MLRDRARARSARRRRYDDLVTKFLEHFALISDAMRRQRRCGTRRTASTTTCFARPDGSASPLRVRSMVGCIPLFATGASDETTRPAAREARASGFAALAAPARASTTRTSASRRHRCAASRRPAPAARRRRPPDRFARVLAQLFDEDEFLSPHGLRGVSRRHAASPPHRADRGGTATDRLRARGVDDRHVRRQLELAGPGVVPAQLPADRTRSSATTPTWATRSRWSTRPAPASSATRARSPTTCAQRLLVALRRGSRTGAGPLSAGYERLQNDPRLAGQPALLRVLPRRQRRRPRRLAPDRLDGADRRPDLPPHCCRPAGARAGGGRCRGTGGEA